MRQFSNWLRRAFVSGALLLTLSLAGGCSTFNHDWAEAASPPNSLEGRWQGVWTSDVDGHTGKLRCIVTDLENGTYRAYFHAKYRKIFSFSYTVPLKVERKAGVFRFSGEADLGWLAGGRYNYEGEADGTNFFSIYRCRYDHGTFQMTRAGE